MLQGVRGAIGALVAQGVIPDMETGAQGVMPEMETGHHDRPPEETVCLNCRFSHAISTKLSIDLLARNLPAPESGSNPCAGNAGGGASRARDEIKVQEGQEITGKIRSIKGFGAFVNLYDNKDGLLHVNEMPEGSGSATERGYKEGEDITVRTKAQLSLPRHGFQPWM